MKLLILMLLSISAAAKNVTTQDPSKKLIHPSDYHDIMKNLNTIDDFIEFTKKMPNGMLKWSEGYAKQSETADCHSSPRFPVFKILVGPKKVEGVDKTPGTALNMILDMKHIGCSKTSKCGDDFKFLCLFSSVEHQKKDEGSINFRDMTRPVAGDGSTTPQPSIASAQSTLLSTVLILVYIGLFSL